MENVDFCNNLESKICVNSYKLFFVAKVGATVKRQRTTRIIRSLTPCPLGTHRVKTFSIDTAPLLAW